MASLPILNVLEKSQVSPPRATVDTRLLPLTFFDISWLPFSPVHNLFFYEFPITKTHSVEKCTLDFNDLTRNHPRDCDKFYPLIPILGHASKVCDYVKIPIFSFQVTFFPDCGISIGMINHHCLGDASNRFRFLMAWTSIARSRTDESFLAKGDFPLYDRVMKYPKLDEIYLNKAKLETLSQEYKPKFIKTRLVPAVPSNYFDSCLATCGAMAKTSVLVEKDGFVTAAKLLGDCLHKKLNDKDGILKDAAACTDFGWGKPKKHEAVGIDYEKGISMSTSKESNEDLEIGICHSVAEMEAFIPIFNGGLEEFI
ncbi:Chloramphenicol acetyltransferase-like domain-containing protein [Artemisia annua]|uniref:Chloramphenicol acetyltransferase-like domain-containing protein n=1 Tax=Artemisia annua TaxID=35608 RepID=A0A2U1L286_ARTAN|nr:Chloramphenicol acetyltransferase-like domain-containing protein [Artemisia annua]